MPAPKNKRNETPANRLYGIRNCDSCKLATRWLDNRSIDYTFVDLRTDGIDESVLERWQQTLGWEALLNKRSITWRKIPPFDRADLDADRARELIMNFPTVMKRPVLDTGEKVLVGFDKFAYQELGLD